jgi:hypothetical protein
MEVYKGRNQMTVCRNCGSELNEKNCTNCETTIRPDKKNISNVLLTGNDIEKAIGFFSTLVSIASSPIKNTLSIASSTEFNQKEFLIKCIAITATLGVLSKVQITNDLVASIFSTVGLFILVYVQIILTYFGFRLLSSTSRSGGDYARLICVAQGVTFLFMGTGELLGLTFGAELYILAMSCQTIILIPYWAMVLGCFWKINPILAYIIYIGSMFPAAVIIILVFPYLEIFIN